MFAFVVAKVVAYPQPGSNEIEKAYEEGWVDKDGYIKENGKRQNKALAFLGDVRDGKGNLVTEVFLVDLPNDVREGNKENPIEGTPTSGPNPPHDVEQKRLTYTADLEYPGIRGSRQWLRSLPDGSLILFPMKDRDGLVQVFGVSPNSGAIRQITYNDFSLETSFSVSPNGKHLAYGYNQDVYVTNTESGTTEKISPDRDYQSTDLGNINWSNGGGILAYNRKLILKDTHYFQVFILRKGDE
jgi:hypothetical protein